MLTQGMHHTNIMMHPLPVFSRDYVEETPLLYYSKFFCNRLLCEYMKIIRFVRF